LRSEIRYYDKMIRLLPTLSSAFMRKAFCHFNLKEYQLADQNAKKAISLMPDEKAYHVNLAAMNIETGKEKEALELVEPLFDDPDLGGIAKSIAGLYYGLQGEFNTCVSLLEEALEAEPKDANILNNLGFYRIRLGETEKALPVLESAIELDPTFAFAFNNRGEAYLKLGQLENAILDINYSLYLNDTNAYAYRNRALYFIEIQDKDQAKKNLEKALSLGFTQQYGSEVEMLLKTL
ncbi:MAG: tetratricopeptide repeat protein, partial [Bacteroidia bacterium]